MVSKMFIPFPLQSLNVHLYLSLAVVVWKSPVSMLAVLLQSHVRMDVSYPVTLIVVYVSRMRGGCQHLLHVKVGI